MLLFSAAVKLSLHRNINDDLEIFIMVINVGVIVWNVMKLFPNENLYTLKRLLQILKIENLLKNLVMKYDTKVWLGLKEYNR